MKNKINHTVRKISKSNRKIGETYKINTPNTHRYITAHSPDLIQALQYKVAGLK